MTRALLVLRPEPGASATASAAAAAGLPAIVAPLFAVRAVDWSPPGARPAAILMTSANAARLGGEALAGLVDLPLYAVGEATAAAARRIGFSQIVVGTGGVDAIVARAGRDGIGRLLHCAGREHRSPDDARVAIERRIVYAADAVTALPDAARTALPEAVALLHSPRAAALFARLVEDVATVSIAAISPAAREAAGGGWAAVVVADRPTDASLLAAAAKLCDQRG